MPHNDKIKFTITSIMAMRLYLALPIDLMKWSRDDT